MTDEQKRIVEALRRCADDEIICFSGTDHRCHVDGVNIDKDDFCQDKLMLAAADMIKAMANTIDELAQKNERIRQNSVSHETYKLAVDYLKSVCKITQDEMKRVGRERDANAVQRDEYREKYVSAECDIRQMKRERDALEYDRDALNAELIQARKERDAAFMILGGEVSTKCGGCVHWGQAPSTNGYINKCGWCELHDVVMRADDVCKKWDGGVCAENEGETQ